MPTPQEITLEIRRGETRPPVEIGVILTDCQKSSCHKLWMHLWSGGKNNPYPTVQDWIAQARPMIAGDGAVVLPAPGFWLAIEADGYAHS